MKREFPLHQLPKSRRNRPFTVPISITGAKVGTIQLTRAAGEGWTENESEIAQAAADLLARQIENLRLLAQAEQYRFEAEQVSRRLTHEGWEFFLTLARNWNADTFMI